MSAGPGRRREVGGAALGWSCFGASDHGPLSFPRVGQSVDLPVKARRWGHDRRGSPQSGCLKPWSRPPPPPTTPLPLLHLPARLDGSPWMWVRPLGLCSSADESLSRSRVLGWVCRWWWGVGTAAEWVSALGPARVFKACQSVKRATPWHLMDGAGPGPGAARAEGQSRAPGPEPARARCTGLRGVVRSGGREADWSPAPDARQGKSPRPGREPGSLVTQAAKPHPYGLGSTPMRQDRVEAWPRTIAPRLPCAPSAPLAHPLQEGPSKDSPRSHPLPRAQRALMK